MTGNLSLAHLGFQLSKSFLGLKIRKGCRFVSLELSDGIVKVFF